MLFKEANAIKNKGREIIKPIGAIDPIFQRCKYYLKLIPNWHIIWLYFEFNRNHLHILQTMKHHFQTDETNMQIWQEALDLNKATLLSRFHIMDEEGQKLTISLDVKKYFQHKVSELPYLDLKTEELEDTHVNYGEFDEVFDEIKEEIKKGNRVSFKLTQELQAMTEELISKVKQKEEETSHKKESVELEQSQFLLLAIEAVDSLQLVYESAMKADLVEWSGQIEMVITNFLATLESYGIQETNVLGKFFDGETMISIGNVPQSIAPDLQRFQVYSVHEKGFHYQESGQLIREAKVTTIY